MSRERLMRKLPYIIFNFLGNISHDSQSILEDFAFVNGCTIEHQITSIFRIF